MNAMDCKDIKALLSALIDDQLDAGDRHQAERHLAECADCRALVNQAESLDELIAAEIALTTTPLPDGFAHNVLSRTVYAEAPRPYAYRWSTWTGWLAAAACLALALTLWVSDQRGGSNGSGLDSSDVAAAPSDGVQIQRAGWRNPLFQSFVHVGALPAESESFAVADAGPDAGVTAPPSTWDDDELALAGTSVLMEMLDDADLDTFADVEQIRVIAEYDELLPRLTAARERLPAESRPAIFAAETILHRIVNGPVSLEDLESLRETAETLHLADEVDAISRRWKSSSSV